MANNYAKNKKFYVLSIDGKEILKKRPDGDGRICLNLSPVKSSGVKERPSPDYKKYVKSKGVYNDNAVFYQIREVCFLPKNNVTYHDVEKSIVFFDFEYVSFSEKDETSLKRAKKLFEEGIYITFRSGSDPVHFVVFDKSASMSREGKITFIDERIKKEMDQRLNLGIRFSEFTAAPAGKVIDEDAKISLSKFYAYRGLYFSDGIRIEKLNLDKETVLVLPDYEGVIDASAGILSAEKQGAGWKTVRTDLSDEKYNFNDGEGIIGPDYAEILSEFLTGDTSEITSFQIRMPFAKGMLHKVDFQKFFRDEVLSEKHNWEIKYKNEDILITDAFGIERKLNKVKIILTASMFKCIKWLKYASRKSGVTDPMELYFNGFTQFGHALYVGNTNKIIKNTGRIAINYQFLNTLAIDKADFDNILDEYIAGAEKELYETDTPEEDAGDDAVIIPADVPNWQAALAIKPELINEAYIKELLRSRRRGYLDRIIKGKIDVSGEMRFLSGDLLAFLNFMLLRAGVDGSDADKKRFEEKIKDIRSQIKEQYIYAGNFYMPGFIRPEDAGENAEKKQSKIYYGLLRNPHLSRCEQCAALPYIPAGKSLHSGYFGHLDGVIMVSKNSLTAMALGGADFDGDLIKIVFDERITNAILKGCYGSPEASGICPRTQPYIRIPSVPFSETIHPQELINQPFRNIQNTFSNQIGSISNNAVKLGAIEYFGTDDEKEEFKDRCEECTIATGLEIDAAKTGMHPSKYISYIAKAAKEAAKRANGSTIYLNTKNTAIKAPHGLTAQRKKEIIKEDSRFYYFPAFDLRIYEEYDFRGNLTMLMSGYYRKLKEAEESGGRSAERGSKVSIVSENAGKVTENFKEAEKVIKAFAKALKLINGFYGRVPFKDTDYYAYVCKLAGLKYGSVENRFPGSEESVIQVIDDAQGYIWLAVDSGGGSNAMLKKLIDRKWQYTPEDKRGDMLEEILGQRPDDKEVIDFLTDFGCRGYYNLYYLLKDSIKTYKLLQDPEEYFKQKGKDISADKYIAEFIESFEENYRKKKPKADTERRLVRMCRDFIKEISPASYDSETGKFKPEVLKLAEKCDSSHRAFWKLFTTEEIIDSINAT